MIFRNLDVPGQSGKHFVGSKRPEMDNVVAYSSRGVVVKVLPCSAYRVDWLRQCAVGARRRRL